MTIKYYCLLHILVCRKHLHVINLSFESKTSYLSLAFSIIYNQWYEFLPWCNIKFCFLTSGYPGWFWCCQECSIFWRSIPCRPEGATRMPKLMRHRWWRHLFCLSRWLRGPRHSTHWNKRYRNYFLQSNDAIRHFTCGLKAM